MNVYALALIATKKLIPVIYALVGFGLLITIHEFGHFCFCKLFGVHTPTFSIGMGPSIFKRKIGQTNFQLALIPIGGYVEIAGMAEVGQGEQKHAEEVGARSFASKPYWQKFFILVGGVLFNLLFAYGVFSTLYFTGMPVQKEVAIEVKSVGSNTDSGLLPGDRIVGINKHELKENPKELFPALRKAVDELTVNKEQKIVLHVRRGGRKFDATFLPEANGTNLSRLLIGGVALDFKPLKVEYEKYPFFTAIKMGIARTHAWIGTVVGSIKMLFTKRNIKDFGGPIMIVSQSFKMAQRGLLMLFVFLAIISINLAVINLLPIGAVDGGQLLFETIEVIIRRKIPEIVRFSINLASWVLILGLILFLSYQDILSLFLRRGS